MMSDSRRELHAAAALAMVALLACTGPADVFAGGQAAKYGKDLKAADPITRQKTVWLIARELPADDAVPLLAETLLKDPEERVRASAAEALGELGPGAVSAVSALVTAMYDTGEMSFVNKSAEDALARIGCGANGQLERLLCGQYGVGAGKALGRVGECALPALVGGLKRPECRRGAALGLRVMVGDISPALPGLSDAVGDADPAVRYDAICALQRMGPNATAAVPALVAALGDSEHHNRVAAANALRAVGPGARAAIPALSKLAADSDVQLRDSVRAALKAIEGP